MSVKFICVVLAFMSLVSCKKEPIQFSFEGHVSETVNDGNLADAVVTISQRVYNGSVASANFNTAGTFTTGSDGNYAITFDREKVFEFKMTVIKSGYFTFEEIIPSGDVSTDEVKITNAEMDAKSWVKFHLVNLGGIPADIFTLAYHNFRTGCDGCTTNAYYYFEGAAMDTTYTILSTGGNYAKYSYKTPGSSVYTYDSVYMTPFDTVTVNINY